MIALPRVVNSVPALAPRLVLLQAPTPLDELVATPTLATWLRHDAAAPLRSDDAIRATVRDALRAAGFKPTGRSKPSSEYLLRASEEDRLATINAFVDLGNAVSLHSGLPISVVDLARCVGVAAGTPLRIAIADVGSRYVFNASAQEIDVGRLPCLFDADGPCANAVKDAQRTKTDATTRGALVVVWAPAALAAHATAAMAWLTDLAGDAGIVTAPVDCVSPDA